MTSAQSTPPWRMQRIDGVYGEFYTISRRQGGRTIHLEYSRDGRPMWWGRQQASDAIDRAKDRDGKQV